MTDYARGFRDGIAAMDKTVSQHIAEWRAEGFRDGVEAAAKVADESAEGISNVGDRIRALRAALARVKPHAA